MSLKFGLVTLGCDKNTVDSERYLADLVAHGAEPVQDLREPVGLGGVRPAGGHRQHAHGR